MARSTLYVGIIAIVLVLVVGSGLFLSSTGTQNQNSTNSGCCSTSRFISLQAGNRTVMATYVPPGPPTPDTTSTASTTSLYTTGTSAGAGTYTYAYNSQVEVLSVSAHISDTQFVTFSVQYKNISNETISVATGGGSALAVAVSANSAVVGQVQETRCLVATALVPLTSGQTYTSTAPGCWSGYSYKLLAPGIMQLQLTLSWSADSGASHSGSLVISATFSLS